MTISGGDRHPRRRTCLSRSLTLLAAAVVCAAPAFAAESAASSSIRVVNCDAVVASQKRGICANHLEQADFRALSPGVSWWYNWFYKPDATPPPGVHMEFLPMTWGDKPEFLTGLSQYLAAGNRPKHILAINEPNLHGQSFITPEQAAMLYKRIKAVADRYNIPVVGPQMALGSAKEASITAMDPIENKTVTYTFMVPFEKAFLYYTGSTEVAATSLHSYGSIDEMRWAVGLMHKEFQRPVWVTEYAHVPNPQDGLTYLMQSTDFLERSPDVAGYAWFKERLSGNDASLALLQQTPGQLTLLGEAYVAMPVHDANLYYRIPGRLQAERYTTEDKMEIWPTTDTDGFAQMASTDAGATIIYNLQVDRSGPYTLRFRVSGATGRIETLSSGAVLSSIDVPSLGNGWQTISTRVSLSAGPQTIQVRCGARGQVINWIEFVKE